MLSEYFSLDISDSGLVESLPLLLRDYTPNLDNLPSFLMRLGPQVSLMLLVITLIKMACLRWIGRQKPNALTLSSVNLPTFIPRDHR